MDIGIWNVTGPDYARHPAPLVIWAFGPQVRELDWTLSRMDQLLVWVVGALGVFPDRHHVCAPIGMPPAQLYSPAWDDAVPQLLICAIDIHGDLPWVARTTFAELNVSEEEMFVLAVVFGKFRDIFAESHSLWVGSGEDSWKVVVFFRVDGIPHFSGLHERTNGGDSLAAFALACFLPRGALFTL